VTISNPHLNFDLLLQEAIDREDSGQTDQESSDEEDTFTADLEDTANGEDPDRQELGEPLPKQARLLSSKERRRAQKKSQSHSHRARQRREVRGESFSHHERKSSTYQKYVASSTPIVTPMSTSNAPVAKTGFVGLDDGTRSQKEYRLEDMVGEESLFNFRLQTWEGRCANSQQTFLWGILLTVHTDPQCPSLPGNAA
jgi:hypothetical protein